MLLLLTGPWLVIQAAARIRRQHWPVQARSAAAVGAGVLFIFTGVGHFVQTEAMTQMLPAWVPGRTPLVYLTGLLEFAIALGFFIPAARRHTGLLAIAVLIAFFPANIYAAFSHIPLSGNAWGPAYLLVRAPLQAIIIAWIYGFTVRRPAARQ